MGKRFVQMYIFMNTIIEMEVKYRSPFTLRAFWTSLHGVRTNFSYMRTNSRNKLLINLKSYIFFSSLFQEYSLRTGFGLLHYYTTIVIYFIYLCTDKITNLQPICNLMHYTTNNNLTFILQCFLYHPQIWIFEPNLTIQL